MLSRAGFRNKGEELENTDGADVPRSIGQHRPEDRLLAEGIRGPV
jgi:hypothetical protein